MDFTFEYSDYRKQENTIVSIELVSSRQIKRKYPKFILELNSKYGTISHKINTRRLNETTFMVLDGYGQLTDGLIKVVRE